MCTFIQMIIWKSANSITLSSLGLQINKHALPHAILTLWTISLVRLGQGYTYSKQVQPSPVPFYGTTHFWQSIFSLAEFLQAETSCILWGSYIGWIVTENCEGGRGTDRRKERDRNGAGFEWIALPLLWLVISDLVSTPIQFRPVLLTACVFAYY